MHSREIEEREEVTLDEFGEFVGPNDKVVNDLCYFLGTIARNASFCPLIYTNFKAFTDKEKEDIWEYVTVCESNFYISFIFQIPFKYCW